MRIKYASRTLPSSHSPTASGSLQPTPSALPRVSIDAEPQRSIMERILTAFRFYQIPYNEYLDMLKRKQNGYLQRIAVLEMEQVAARVGKVEERGIAEVGNP